MSLSFQNLVARITGNRRPDGSVKLVPGVVLEGSLTCAGKIEVFTDCGCSLATKGQLVVREGGLVRKAAVAGDALIEGKVEAGLEVNGELELAPSSHIRGTVKAGSLKLAPGAEADVQLELGPVAESSRFDSPVIAIRPSARAENPRKRVEIDLSNL